MMLIPSDSAVAAPFSQDEEAEAQRGEVVWPGHTAPGLRELTAHFPTPPLRVEILLHTVEAP